MIYFAGIGSRETPEDMLKVFTCIGAFLCKIGFVLRSGGSNGADNAFERGCDSVNGEKEIFLPWKNFNLHISGTKGMITLDEKRFRRLEAYQIAKEIHPNWGALDINGEKLMTRNTYQILGEHCNNRVIFVVCYADVKANHGGTLQAIRLAEKHNIPVINAYKFTSHQFYHLFALYIKQLRDGVITDYRDLSIFNNVM